MIVIITCGQKKCLTPSKAKLMYRGGHFKKCYKWALSKVDDDKIFILSAKYGLLKTTDIIQPYDLKMGQKGCVTSLIISEQADKFNIKNELILSTAGLEYRNVLNEVFKNIKYPFFGLSMGYMGQAMKQDLCKN